jgi:hypothetical protein
MHAARKNISKAKSGDGKYESFPMVHVVWNDAAHSGADGWQTLKDIDIPVLGAEACGFQVPVDVNKDGQKCIVLASAIVFEEEGPPSFCVSFVIPEGMIVKLTEIGK